jgi:hypothetical protein
LIRAGVVDDTAGNQTLTWTCCFSLKNSIS